MKTPKLSNEVVLVCLHNDPYGVTHPDKVLYTHELKEIGGWLACDVCGKRMWNEDSIVVKLHAINWLVDKAIAEPLRRRFLNFRSSVLYASSMDVLWNKFRPAWLAQIKWGLIIAFTPNAQFKFKPSEGDIVLAQDGEFDFLAQDDVQTALDESLDWLVEQHDDWLAGQDDFEY